MAEVIETNDLTAPSQNGSARDYRIRREDGEQLYAEVRCWETNFVGTPEQVVEKRAGRLGSRSG